MMNRIKKIITGGLHRFGRELLSTQAYKKLQERSEELDRYKQQLREYEFLRGVMPGSAAEVLRLLPQSHSQLQQDLFVLAELEFKHGGFFVEFGATDGVELSNTLLLEKQFGWTGILAEPATIWHTALRNNRRCIVDQRCVWTASGETLQFAEVAASPMLSTVGAFVEGDMHKLARTGHKNYEVKTVSLRDLLRDHQAPYVIDYLSIDTEGSEYDILSAFDFEAYRIRVITVEHNFTPAREKLRLLLESYGYVRKLQSISQFDDWYVLETHESGPNKTKRTPPVPE